LLAAFSWLDVARPESFLVSDPFVPMSPFAVEAEPLSEVDPFVLDVSPLPSVACVVLVASLPPAAVPDWIQWPW
jgi:hypothetical protein